MATTLQYSAEQLEQRRQIADVLENAKLRLWNGKGTFPRLPPTSYICLALAAVAARHPSKAQDACSARYVIMDRLQRYKCSTVSTYLRAHLQVPLDQWTPENIQEFRHRWIDELIKEFSQ